VILTGKDGPGGHGVQIFSGRSGATVPRVVPIVTNSQQGGGKLMGKGTDAIATAETAGRIRAAEMW